MLQPQLQLCPKEFQLATPVLPSARYQSKSVPLMDIQFKCHNNISRSNTFYSSNMNGLSLLVVLLVIQSVSTESAQHSFSTAPQHLMTGNLHEIAAGLTPKMHREIRMTTRELTLNLSGISFPGPARWGDNLNFTGLSVPSVAGRCGEGYLLNRETMECKLADLLLMQNFDAQNLILGQLNLNSLRRNQQEFLQSNPTFRPIKCDFEKPFLSRQGCTSCLDPSPYFNLQTLKCASCPLGSSYSPDVRNCQQGGRQYLTNLGNPNILVQPDRSIGQYRSDYDRLRQATPGLQTCPQNRPFSTGGECVACPIQDPLFFLPARYCTKCRTGSKFNPETNLCVETARRIVITGKDSRVTRSISDSGYRRSGTQKWTVEKGLGNIFGWSRDDVQSDSRVSRRDRQNGRSQGSEIRTRTASNPRFYDDTTTTTATKRVNRFVKKETSALDQPRIQVNSNDDSTTTLNTKPTQVITKQATSRARVVSQEPVTPSNSTTTSTTTVKKVEETPIEQKPAEE